MSDTISISTRVVCLTASVNFFSFCREKPDSSLNTNVLNEEAIVRGSSQESLSKCPDVGLIRQIIPETVAMTTLECYSKENNELKVVTACRKHTETSLTTTNTDL